MRAYVCKVSDLPPRSNHAGTDLIHIDFVVLLDPLQILFVDMISGSVEKRRFGGDGPLIMHVSGHSLPKT